MCVCVAAQGAQSGARHCACGGGSGTRLLRAGGAGGRQVLWDAAAVRQVLHRIPASVRQVLHRIPRLCGKCCMPPPSSCRGTIAQRQRDYSVSVGVGHSTPPPGQKVVEVMANPALARDAVRARAPCGALAYCTETLGR